jgi:carbamate kinase
MKRKSVKKMVNVMINCLEVNIVHGNEKPQVGMIFSFKEVEKLTYIFSEHHDSFFFFWNKTS